MDIKKYITNKDLEITTDGWYALLAYPTDKTVSLEIEAFSETIPIATGVGITPWVYLKKDTQNLSYTSNATMITLITAPSIGAPYWYSY